MKNVKPVLFSVMYITECNNYPFSSVVVGETIISPGSRQGLIPLAIPLSENLSGRFIFVYSRSYEQFTITIISQWCLK